MHFELQYFTIGLAVVFSMEDSLKGPYLLKLLAGPNQGAEIALNEETLLVGSGETCDIILSDSLVAAEHIKLHIESSRVTLTPLAAGVTYETKVLEPNKALEIKAFSLIGLGTTYLIIGPQNTSWPRISLEGLLQKTKDDAEAAATQDLFGKIKKIGKKRGHILLTGVVILLLALLVLSNLPRERIADPNRISQGTGSSGNTRALEKDLKAYLEKLREEKGLVLEKAADGVTVLSGYLKTFKERLDIERSLRPYQSTIRVKIMDQESMLTSARELLQVLKVTMLVSALPDGGLQLEGYANSQEKFDDLKSRLMQDVPSLKYVEGKLLTDTDIVQKALDLMATAELEDKLGVGIENDVLTIAGYLSKQQEKAWIAVYTQIRSELTRYLRIIKQVQILDDKTFIHWVFGNTVDSTAVTHSNRWVSLVNGEKLFEGAKLQHDYVLNSIEKDHLVIRKGKTQLRFSINN